MTLQSKKLAILTIPALATLFVIGMITPSYSSGIFVCDNTVITGTLDKDVYVPENSVCHTGDHATINGNIESDGTLILERHATVNGNIESHNILYLGDSGGPSPDTINGNINQIGGSIFTGVEQDGTLSIFGNIFVKNASIVEIAEATVSGNVQIQSSERLDLNYSTFEKNLSLKNNEIIRLFHMTIEGNAVCSGNDSVEDSGVNHYGKNDGCPE